VLSVTHRIVSKETNNINIYDLNRLNRFILRSERNGNEIYLRDAFRLRTACEVNSIAIVVLSKSCTSLVSNIMRRLSGEAV
jgi:hypothetical protein